MSSPVQQCNANQEDLLKDKKLDLGVGDFCPLCKDLGADVKVGFHKSRAAAPAVAAAAASSSAKKRKSLPPPASGSDWKANYLDKLHISIAYVDDQTMLSVGKVPQRALTARSETASALTDSCAFISADSVSSLLPIAAPAEHVHRAGWQLYKYLRLILGPDKLGLESVVDDLVIHLLAALGYNDGNLVILSKNKLTFTMNSAEGKENMSATADVTVYDVANKFRLAVFEDKPELSRGHSDQDLRDYEAQLMAETVAAAQANMKQQTIEESKRKRAKSADDADAAVAAAQAPVLVSSPGPLYMLRVVGDKFSFYSTELSARFLEVVSDYSCMGDADELPVTMVYKYSLRIPRPAAGASASASSAAPTRDMVQDQWQFQNPNDRSHIIRMLDQILQILRR